MHYEAVYIMIKNSELPNDHLKFLYSTILKFLFHLRQDLVLTNYAKTKKVIYSYPHKDTTKIGSKYPSSIQVSIQKIAPNLLHLHRSSRDVVVGLVANNSTENLKFNVPIISPSLLDKDTEFQSDILLLKGTPKPALMEYLTPHARETLTGEFLKVYRLSSYFPLEVILENFSFEEGTKSDPSCVLLAVSTGSSIASRTKTNSKVRVSLKKPPSPKGLTKREINQIFLSDYASNNSFIADLILESIVQKINQNKLGIESSYSPLILNKFPEIQIIDPFSKSRKSEKSEVIQLDPIIQRASLLKQIGLTFFGEKIIPSDDFRSENIGVIPQGCTEKLKNTLEHQTLSSWILLDSHLKLNKFLSSSSIQHLIVLNGDNDYPSYFLSALQQILNLSGANYVAAKWKREPKRRLGDLSMIFTQSEMENVIFTTDNNAAINFVLNKTQKLEQKGLEVLIPTSCLEIENIQNHTNSCFENPKISVVVPIFNNGNLLITKCIPSLIQNDLWKDMEVILVDDGSTDAFTINICKALARIFPNVTTHFYPSGGSGSASRPRNFGILNAKAPLLTFLDPDNEISRNGYDKLFEIFNSSRNKNHSLDFITGFQLKMSTVPGLTCVHTGRKAQFFKNSKEKLFQKGSFPTFSTQAALISTRFLRQKNILFVEGAVGQDTLFGWQIALEASSFIATNRAHIIYYADRSGSVTNESDSTFFEKALIREKAQVELLRKHQLLQIYKRKRLDSFISNWYEPRLEKMQSTERKMAEDTLNKIRELYSSN